MSKKVLLGFSGGIDSFASVTVLREQGFDVVGLYLDISGDKAMFEQVRQRAAEAEVELVVDNVGELFKREVEDYFFDSYMMGRTPVPCWMCNTQIKWKRLDQVSKDMGIPYIATGHYFSISQFENRYYVTRGADPLKDQSYYLWDIPSEILQRVVTPLAGYSKEQIKARFAQEQRVSESMGVCFLKGQSYVDILKQRFDNQITRGDIVDPGGKVLGSHEGYPYYTIGQKKGLQIADTSQKYCITAIDTANNRLVAGQDKDLYFKNLVIGDCHIVDLTEWLQSDDCQVIIRGIGRNPEGVARLSVNEPLSQERGRMMINIALQGEAWAPAVGQPVVIYRQKRVVGGGILEKYF